ncbi:hypothetical protein [Micromonospora sp. NPDC023956]|uniref:hypothetical protein n=1 Tax=Micromonospora sp. NPDC023956 TaxID=3155722 RepID=UPI00340CC9B7
MEIEEELFGGGGVGVDPALAVLVGSLGIDISVALDYRSCSENPRIIYLAPDGWREVAPNFGAFCQRLGL